MTPSAEPPREPRPTTGPSRAQALGAVGLACALLLAGTEACFRLALRPDPGFYKFLFYTRLKTSRWSFLESNRARLQTETVLSYPPGLDSVEKPEPDRPAFDRIATPYHLVTNADGYRARPFVWPARRPLVFLLGDSITAGRGVELPDLISERLRRALPSGATVLNFGVGGCTSSCMAGILERYIVHQPDLVILQASMNDLDLTMWRQAREGRLTGPGAILLAGAAAAAQRIPKVSARSDILRAWKRISGKSA